MAFSPMGTLSFIITRKNALLRFLHTYKNASYRSVRKKLQRGAHIMFLKAGFARTKIKHLRINFVSILKWSVCHEQKESSAWQLRPLKLQFASLAEIII